MLSQQLDYMQHLHYLRATCSSDSSWQAQQCKKAALCAPFHATRPTEATYTCMFRWLDGLPSPSSSNYVHWGTNMPDGVKEPNNASPRRNERNA